MRIHRNGRLGREITETAIPIAAAAACAVMLSAAFAPGGTSRAAEEAKPTVVTETPYDGATFLGAPVRILGLEAGSERSASGHGYAPVAKLSLDWGELSEDERYWFLKDGAFAGRCWFADKSNGASGELERASVRVDGDVATFEWRAGEKEEWMRPFDEAEIVVAATFLERHEWEEGEGGNAGAFVTERETYVLEAGGGAGSAQETTEDAGAAVAPAGKEDA